ncbi:MAG: hypothetical protein H8E34_04710 [Bacteroidetes bacterium]|nr:hypothetical protein [Bacteroidota bacterium]MBL6943444.1 hypothetical protein [Bacteroidales bacterium]
MMKKNKKLILIIVLFAPVAIWFVMKNDSSTLQESESEFAINDTASVTKIFMADKQTNSVLLERTSDGWLLDSKYKTNTKVVDFLLETMHRIRVKSPVPIAARDNIIKRMASIGIKVEIYQDAYRINLFDKIKLFPYEMLAKVYYVGDVTPNNLGTYMLIEDAEHPYVTHIPGFRGFLTPRYSPIPDDWKSHQVFKHTLSDIKNVSVEFIEFPEESFMVDITSSDGGYNLRKLQDSNNVSRFDTLRLLNFLTSFSDLRYESRLNNIMSPIIIDSIVNSPAMFEITLIDNKNNTTCVTAFNKKALSKKIKDEAYFKLIPDDRDRFYALINYGEDFVLMQYYTFDKVLYPLSYYARTN